MSTAQSAVLRRTQRNEVLETIVAAGLDPSHFSWEQMRHTVGVFAGPADLISHRDGYFYEFRLVKNGQHYARVSPGSDVLEGTVFPGDWKHQLGYLRIWAQDLRTELDAPDLWTHVATWESLTELPPSFEDNSAFSPPELVELDERLDQISSRLALLVDSDDHQPVAVQLVEHLRQEAPRQGRRDWFFLALGSLMSFMVNAAFDPLRAREIVELLASGIRSIGSG